MQFYASNRRLAEYVQQIKVQFNKYSEDYVLDFLLANEEKEEKKTNTNPA